MNINKIYRNCCSFFNTIAILCEFLQCSTEGDIHKYSFEYTDFIMVGNTLCYHTQWSSCETCWETTANTEDTLPYSSLHMVQHICIQLIDRVY